MSKAKTTSQFIKEVQVFFPQYDYSKVDYKNNFTKVKIVCPTHGEFEITPNSILVKRGGCPLCQKQNKSGSWSKEYFIETANIKFKGKFDYSKVEYINKSTPVVIICPIHGEFKVTPSRHLISHSGCAACAGVKKKDTKQFIEEAQKLFPQYDYSEVEYINCRTPVKVICLLHGPFYINPKEHIGSRKCKCSKCSIEEYRVKTALTFNEWLFKVFERHPSYKDQYDYSFAFYINDKTPLQIRCKKCDSLFWTTPRNHFNSKYGCQTCNNLRISKRMKDNKHNPPKGTSTFIKEVILIHGDKFNYNKVEYINTKTPVIITCKKHNHTFRTLPPLHLEGVSGGCSLCNKERLVENNLHTVKELQKLVDLKYGENMYDLSTVENYTGLNKFYNIKCLSCNTVFSRNMNYFLSVSEGCPCQREVYNKSSFERNVEKVLIQYNIVYEDQKRFENCKYKNLLSFDFYLPENNTLIEVQGQQHYYPVCFGGISLEEAEALFKIQVIKDKIKKKFCKDYGIDFLEIPFDKAEVFDVLTILKKYEKVLV